MVPRIDRLVVAWDYDGSARSLVLTLKVRGLRSPATELAAALAERIAIEGSAAGILTWVPGRGADIKRRGFDHAELIARALGANLGLPCLPLLRRAHDGVDQTSLGARDRKANLAGAFVARRSGPRIGVVDDLVTTGATMAEAGRALRVAGASYVEGLSACSVS